ncbi:MAG: glycosyltransferase [Chloroflexota bacterium]
MKLALVHDWLNQMGGAEDVLEVLVDLYPESPVYTSIYDPLKMPESYREWDIRTLWVNNMPAIHNHHQPYLPLYPAAWTSLDMSAYDVVLSNKSGFCHVFRHDASTLHICYCLAPTRYVWQVDSYLKREGYGRGVRAAISPMIALLRFWDFTATRSVNHFIAISTAIQQRIKAYYRRNSVIIYPPVETERFEPAPRHDDYFLCVSRLIPYKRIDLAVQAATKLGVPLKIAGRGRALDDLKEIAGPTVEFLGYVPDEDLNDLMARCKAFIFPGLEDFGIAPVQAMAAGRPVIAYAGGGALDTVKPGVTGELFHTQDAESLAKVMENFDAAAYSPATLRREAEQYDRSIFEREIASFVEQAHDATHTRKPFQWEKPVHTNA